MKPKEFWQLTYAELREMIKGYERTQRLRRNLMMSQAWHIANWSRAKKMPSYNEVIEKQPRKKKSVDDIVQVCRNICIAYGGKEVKA